ncbi:hypothetical protein [Novosphingobium sp.]|uniref:hypothetical protein n=1 Tax=Novosphingobium sp. TaxID=1874826 RepID=UPI003D0E9CB3
MKMLQKAQNAAIYAATFTDVAPDFNIQLTNNRPGSVCLQAVHNQRWTPLESDSLGRSGARNRPVVRVLPLANAILPIGIQAVAAQLPRCGAGFRELGGPVSSHRPVWEETPGAEKVPGVFCFAGKVSSPAKMSELRGATIDIEFDTASMKARAFASFIEQILGDRFGPGAMAHRRKHNNTVAPGLTRGPASSARKRPNLKVPRKKAGSRVKPGKTRKNKVSAYEQ